MHLITQLVKNLPAMQETPIRFLGWEHPLDGFSRVAAGTWGIFSSYDGDAHSKWEFV